MDLWRRSISPERRSVYGIWAGMKSRCRDSKLKIYPHYGGRGIRVCDRWQNFEAFFADMGPREAGQTLERVNNDGNYEPNNCRWASQKEQCNNKRSTIWITFDGQTKTIPQWAAEKAISESQLRIRIRRYGWSPERALSEPIHVRRAR